MNAKILRKLAVLCLVLVLTGVSWANCTKDGACKKGDDQKACESKEKKGDCDKKAKSEKSQSQDQESKQSTENAG